MNFPDTISAAARGDKVAIVTLVYFDFVDDPFRAWTGAGTIVVNEQTWYGLGELAGISALPLGVGDSAGQVSFTLSGVDPEIVALARSESNKVQNRRVSVWKQFLSAPQQPLDLPIYMGAWIMMAPKFTFSGPSGRTISVSARSIFDDRQLHEEDYYSDRRQQAILAGDKFFEFISEITTGVKVLWPDHN